MQPHPRIRKTVKWGGLALTVVLVVVWIGSTWRYVAYGFPAGLGLVLCDGGVVASWYTPHELTSDEAYLMEARLLIRPPWPAGFSGGRESGAPYWLVYWSSLWGNNALFIPLWPLPLGCVIVTLIAWRLDALARRRAEAHLCPTCRYDRSGLAASAVCPECGAAAPSGG